MFVSRFQKILVILYQSGETQIWYLVNVLGAFHHTVDCNYEHSVYDNSYLRSESSPGISSCMIGSTHTDTSWVAFAQSLVLQMGFSYFSRMSVNVRVWHVSILKSVSKWINQMTGKNPGYHTSTFSSENFPESWCNTKLVMDTQNWTTRLAYTNILQISVHLVAKKTKLHYNNNKKGFSNLIKKISSFKMCSCRYFRNNGLHQIP